MSRKYSVDEVRAAARAVVREKPDERNPVRAWRDGLFECLYTAHDDPNRHCLGGAVLLHLGLELPMEGNRIGGTPDAARLTDRALWYLLNLQRFADIKDTAVPGNDGSIRMRWREAFHMAEEERREYEF